MISVQLWKLLGEDDIVRTDDIYYRAPEETKQRSVLSASWFRFANFHLIRIRSKLKLEI